MARTGEELMSHPWWRRTPGWTSVLALGAAVMATSCQGSPARAAPLPAPPAVVDVTMSEYRFEYPPVVPSGRVVFRVRNAGQVEHQLELLHLSEEFPPIDVQVRGSERRVVTPLAGVRNRRPGASGTFAVDLVPGRRYAIVCFVRDSDGEVHAVKGMNSEFRPSANQTQAPSSRDVP